MRYLIDNQGIRDPGVNLALEEYCLTNLKSRHEYVLLYVNEPSVIVGRNQNILQEIDQDYVNAQRIRVMRRLSGGGAVYHDKGNINLSFIQRRGEDGLKGIKRFLAPILQSLRQMGVDARINERSDLVVGTKKISGSARFSNTRRVMVHGTLLFDTDLHALSQALSPPDNRLLTRAVPSVRHPVANIRPLLDRMMNTVDFVDRLLLLLRRQVGKMQKLSLDEHHWQRIHRLAAEKYRSWEWTFGHTPDFSVVKNGCGNNRLRIDVHRGKITGIVALGPDNSAGHWREIENRLAGRRYDPDAVATMLDNIRIPINDCFPDSEQLAIDSCSN